MYSLAQYCLSCLFYILFSSWPASCLYGSLGQMEKIKNKKNKRSDLALSDLNQGVLIMSKISKPVSFTQFVKSEKIMFNLTAFHNLRKAMSKVSIVPVEAQAMLEKGMEAYESAILRYKEYVLNRITPGAGTVVVEILTEEQKQEKVILDAIMAMQYPLMISFPAFYCVGKGSGQEIATKANAFVRELRSTISPSTIEGIVKGTLSLAWLCEKLGIKKASEARQIIGKVCSTSRSAWLDGDSENYLSCSIGKDSGTGVICFKWTIKE